ncbi:hypothetical protein EU546_07820 [Candidatus Thorarchaeota archaeon]|nr:MAG: hypothetical protein EU546_07820 [Candidatus Thorarchaeota archaeon]
MKKLKIGDVESKPGELVCGYMETISIPTGGAEMLPVMIAQGEEEGPTFFLTANVHGNELTGVAVIHDVVTQELAERIKGTVVAIPSLNPTGLRLGTRNPTFDDRDPNRLFPEGRFKDEDAEDEDAQYPKPYEQVASKVYSLFDEHADYHIDIHNHSIRSIPYAIIDRVFYEGEEGKDEAKKLSDTQQEIVAAFGIMATADFPAKKYLKLKYHRSLSGAVLNSLRIPAFTVELGANTALFPEIVAGSVKGTRNALRWAGMLDGSPERITEFDTPRPKKRIRRIEHPRAETAGIVKIVVDPGQHVEEGDPIARFTDILGKPIGDGYIRTEHDGYMIALRSNMTVYTNDQVAEMGIEDDEPLIAEIPK